MKSWGEWLEDTLDRMFWVSSRENMSQETFKKTMNKNKTYSKALAIFDDGYPLDFEEVVAGLETKYRLGYAGLFHSDRSILVAMQVLPKSTCLRLEVVQNICQNYNDAGNVKVVPLEKDTMKEFGEAVTQKGQLRGWGGSRKRRRRNDDDLHALGHEDLSHISVEKLKDLVGTEDEVLAFFRKNCDKLTRLDTVARQWEKYRVFSRNKVRRWDDQEKSNLCQQYGISGYYEEEEDSEVSESENSTEDSESDDDDDDDSNDYRIQKKPEYDPDSDSEGNQNRKEHLLRLKFLSSAPRARKDTFLQGFEELLLQNPKNRNVMATTKEAYFKYYSGTKWVKAPKQDFFQVVTLSRISKASECNQTLKWGFAHCQISKMVRLLRNESDSKDIVAQGILTAENR